MFADLTPSPPDYEIELSGREFQTRNIPVSWPGAGPMELDSAGEDELQVIVTGINASRIEFSTIAFVATILAGADVVGESGFSTALVEDLEGVNVNGAELVSVAGLTQGQALRIVRSRRLVLRPGPYYPFPQNTTLAAFRVVEVTAGEPPLPGAQIEITGVNGAVVTSVDVDGVDLFRCDLPGSPPTPFLVGTEAARATLSDVRGSAVFYYPPTTPVTSLSVRVSKDGYVTQDPPALVVQPGERRFAEVRLVRDV